MELRMKKNQDKYQNDKRPGYRGLETIKEDPRESMRSSPFSRPNVRNSPVGNYPRRNSPIRNSPRRNSPRRNSPRRNSPRRNSPGRTFEQRRSPLRKPWQIDRNKDTYSNRPFGNSPIGKFGQRDTEVDFSKRNNTGNFIIRSPEISYCSQNTNTRDFRGNERGFSSHSARKCESRNDYSCRQNGRVSDVSMRSVTPVKTGNSFYDNGSFGKQSNPNPFSKNSTSRENQFASKQNFLNDNQSFKVFEKPQNRNNPFLPNNTDKFNNSEISNPFKVKNSSNATNSFGKTSISKIFEAKSSNPFAKFSVDKENIVNNYQIDFIQPCKVEPIQKLHFVNNMNIMGNQAAVMNLNPSKTPAEILSEVCNYFLHTQSVTTDHDLNNSPQIQELQLTENKQFIVKPLSEIYLKDIPVNDSFKELYKKEQMYDIDLYFPKDKVHIQAHKIVLSTVDKLKQHIETKLKDRISGDMPVIEFSLDYGSEVFSKVLKILYLGTNKIYDINLAEGREMYRLACKLGAKNVQRYLVIYCLLPKLNLSQCLSVLEDAYNRISQTTVDEIVKMLFEFTIIYCARRFSILCNSKIEVLLKLDRHLLKILVSKSLYFATDEHDVLNFLKIVVNKETNDIYGFLSKISEPYRKTVAYNYKSINIALILKELGSSPMRYPYLNSEVSSKSCKYGFGKSQAQLDSKRKSLNLKKLEEVRSNEFENQSPLENRIPLNHEINSKDFNLDLTIKINPEDFSKEGVTFFSECFYSFSATWNLMIDILPSGAVNVYLVERTYRQPQSLAESNNMTVFNYQSRIANQSLKPKDLINDGKNATFLINYKSVLFSVSLIDARLTKDFKIFYSFCKDQNQAIGCENFFNISQLSCQDFIHLRVKILEDILHSSTLHAISSHFSEMANIIAEKYPECERQINYCFSNKDESRNSDDYKRPSIDRYDDFGLNKNNKNQYEYFLDNKRKRRPSTPPSCTKNKWQLDCGKEKRHEDRRPSKASQASKSDCYLNIPYYDLSFLLDSDFINVESEQTILDVVYRYATMVIRDSAVINRLCRCIRFNYLDFGELLRISSEGKNVFKLSSEFQNSLVCEMDRRMKGTYSKSKLEYEKPRLNYISKDMNELNCNISEVISKWVVEEGNNSKLERKIKLLKFKLEEQYNHNKKIKRRYEEDIKGFMNDKDKYVK